MSSTSERSSEKMFLCSICLEVFSEPVTTPCGHNFCRRCISQAWDTDGPCRCPLCNEMFHSRPQLKVNTLLKEVASASNLELQTQALSQHRVEQRRQKIQEIQSLLELSETEVLRERAAGLQVFTALIQSVQRRLDLFLEELQEKQSRSHRRAQDLLQRLKQEICDLEQSGAEAECLSRSHDPLHFLQRSAAHTHPAGLKEWSSVSFEPETCEGSVARALSELQNSLSQEFKKHFKELASKSKKAELKRAQQSAVEVTLDPDTAHPRLTLSEDLKQVHHTDVKKKLPKSPLRFDTCPCVLGKQSFSSGRFYFEVQVKGKTDWDLGVVRESINRKGKITLSPRHGLWCIILRIKDEYKACADPPVRLFPQKAPQKVGVFVDYGKGLVSFYDSDSADLLYSFTDCCFREKLFPYFNPCSNEGGSNSAPLVFTAVEI